MTLGVMVGSRGREWKRSSLSTCLAALNKVIAGEDLPRGATATFLLKEVLRVYLTLEGFQIPKEDSPLKEIKLRDNRLYASTGEPSSWLSDLVFAEDVHTETARLDITTVCPVSSDPLLMLTVTKPVKKGDVLSYWFSSELAAKLGFPFLNFSHIKDGQYFCNSCSRNFDAPNPLKLHIATSCETLNPEYLWSRLWDKGLSSLSWTTPVLSYDNTMNKRKILSTSQKDRQTASGIEKTEANSISKIKEPISRSYLARDRQSCPLFSGKSAFKPVLGQLKRNSLHMSRNDISTSSRHSSARMLYSRQSFQGMFAFHPLSNISSTESPHWASTSLSLLQWPAFPSASPPTGTVSASVVPLVNPSQPFLESLPSTSASDPYAEVESLVSALGRGKGSHLCLYCGKVYSRKYGLKIHIRTHTGYKPLKCRVCLRPFGDPSNLNKHVRLHAQGETPYRCDLCGKVLVRKRDLDRHLRSRHSRESLDRLKNSAVSETQEPDTCDESVIIDVVGNMETHLQCPDIKSEKPEKTVKL